MIIDAEKSFHDLNEAYSAKIKKIYVELHDYGFYHNPSEIGNHDRRFLGREGIKTQLKSLLTQNETKSGSYLVTGYRGMGKSSFVNQVVSEISYGYGKKKITARLVRIFLAVILLSLVRIGDQPVISFWLFLLPFIFCNVSAWWLIARSPHQDLNTESPPRVIAKFSLWLVILGPVFFSVFFRRCAPDLGLEGYFWFIVYGFSLCYMLAYLSPLSSDCRSERIPRGRGFFREFYLSLFRFESERVSERRTLAFVFDAFIITLIFLIGHWRLFPQAETGLRLLISLILFLIFLLVNLSYIVPPNLPGFRQTEEVPPPARWPFVKKLSKPLLPVRALWLAFWKAMGRYVNYSHRFYLQINLGHDDLKEVDILRLIAGSLVKCYQRVQGVLPFSFPALIFKTARLTCFFLLFWLVYYNTPISRIGLDLRSSLSMEQYLPSQRYFALPEIPPPVNSPEQKSTAAGSKCPTRSDFLSKLEKSRNLTEYSRMAYFGDTTRQKTATPSGWRAGLVYFDWGFTSLYQLARSSLSQFGASLGLTFVNTPSNYLGLGCEAKHQILPPVPDYFFWGYLMVFWGLVHFWTNRHGFFGLVTHGYMHRKILELNDRIYSQVSRTKSGDFSGHRWSLGVRFFRERRQQYPVADVREIEKEIIDILAEIDRIPRIMGRPQFIFIFDELDKIEPHYNVSLHEKEAEREPPNPTDRGEKLLYQLEETRKRQHTILAILANLKYLLTTAKAKFIFIAGREMYDASLADVSDRHFFIGSIFNAVLYVPSFMTDPSDGHLADVTSMVEQYVCRYLMAESDLLHYGPTLQGYNSYLRERVFPENKGGDRSARVVRRKREKVIHTLSNFIIYLTYRSNGAPKKVTSIFENYIGRPIIRDLKDDRSNLVIGDCSQSSYLSFGFYDQYTFGLISFLAVPFFLTITRNMKHFGDKLLFSTAFLVDHLYKYHAAAFSWRNLELTPEILDIHRSPELRDLIGNLIDYLSNYHIQRIVSGLHDFKFVRKVVEEIHFLSKISEDESAAFNFTLDESLSMKRHYNQRLAGLKADYARMKIPSEEYVNSIGFIHMILGDLYFYDEEYDDAILEYQEAVQTLRQKLIQPDSEKELYLFLLSVRNMLKLGFALEKKKSYDSAFMIYGQLTAMIVRFRYIDLAELGLEERFLKKQQLLSDSLLSQAEKAELEQSNQRRIPLIRPSGRGIAHEEVANPDIVGNERLLGLSKHFMSLLTHRLPFSPIKEKLRFRLSIFEGIRLIYQPFLAKFQLIEKSNLGGVSTSDIRNIQNELNYLLKAINAHERYIIKAEFQNKVADVLYFKNGPKPCFVDEQLKECMNKVESQEDRWWTMAKCKEKGRFPIQIIKNDRKLPCSACELYADSLFTLISDHLAVKATDTKQSFQDQSWLGIWKIVIEKIRIGQQKGNQPEITAETDSENSAQQQPSTEKKESDNNDDKSIPFHPTKDVIAAKSLANTLSNIGDTFYSCCGCDSGKSRVKQSSHTAIWPFLGRLLDLIDDERKDASGASGETALSFNDFCTSHPLEKIEEVLLCYYLSAWVYLRAGERKETAFQYLKMLYVLKDIDYAKEVSATQPKTEEEQKKVEEVSATQFSKDVIEKLLAKIGDTIVRKALRCIVIAYDSIHFLEFERWRSIFTAAEKGKWQEEKQNPNLVSFGNDGWEIVLVYQELRVRIWEALKDNEEIAKERTGFLRSMTVSPYAEIDSMYNRIIELRMKAIFNYLWWKVNILPNDKPNDKPNVNSRLPSFENSEEHIPASSAIGFIIVDSLFCLMEIVRISMMFGFSYMVNHSLVGMTHRKLVFWCQQFQRFDQLFDQDPGWSAAKKDLEIRLGSVDTRTLTAQYQAEAAIRHLRQALETHSEGKTYRTFIEHVYYLNDDFNDNLNHFCAASERYRINTEKVKNYIKELEKEPAKAPSHWLYDWRSYLGDL